MLGGRLGLGERCNIGIRKVRDDCAQSSGLGQVDWSSGSKKVTVGQVNEPFDFDLHASAVESGFAQIVSELRHRLSVATVEGAEGLR